MEPRIISAWVYDMSDGMTYVGEQSDNKCGENEKILKQVIMIPTKQLIKDYDNQVQAKYLKRESKARSSCRINLDNVISSECRFLRSFLPR